MLKSLDSILHTCVVVIVDLIDIITNRDDSWLGVTLSGAVREQQRCVVSLFTLGATKPSQLCVVCLLISLQCRTPCLIDWGARWRADPSSCHRVVWSLWRQRCGQAAVCQAEVAVLCTCQCSRRTWRRESLSGHAALASWHRWPSHTPTALDTE